MQSRDPRALARVSPRFAVVEDDDGATGNAPPAWRSESVLNRKLIATLAGVGLVDSSYLTLSKFGLLGGAGASSMCGTGGCTDVLDSVYASAFGLVPLSALGLVAYTAVLGLALFPIACALPGTPARAAAERATRPALLGAATTVGASRRVCFGRVAFGRDTRGAAVRALL